MPPEVLVFVMNGCGACAEMKPLVNQIAAHYSACVQTHIVDVDADSALADAMQVQETPTIIGVDSERRPTVRMVGFDGTPNRIVALYQKVTDGITSCKVGPFEDI